MYKIICYTAVNNVVVPLPYNVPNTKQQTYITYPTYKQATKVAISLMSKPHPCLVAQKSTIKTCAVVPV